MVLKMKMPEPHPNIFEIMLKKSSEFEFGKAQPEYAQLNVPFF